MTNYAAAIIHYLDRESGEITKAYAYPITKIEFLTHAAEPQGNFVVDEHGERLPDAEL